MEDALVPKAKSSLCRFSACLNPCFNGRCTSTAQEDSTYKEGESSLNPCFNGRCTSTTTALLPVHSAQRVLILVLMEDALVLYHLAVIGNREQVLILVLMEDALVPFWKLCP